MLEVCLKVSRDLSQMRGNTSELASVCAFTPCATSIKCDDYGAAVISPNLFLRPMSIWLHAVSSEFWGVQGRGSNTLTE